MTVYTPKFKAFAIERMKIQESDIRRWLTSDNELLSKICAEIIEAAHEK